MKQIKHIIGTYNKKLTDEGYKVIAVIYNGVRNFDIQGGNNVDAVAVVLPTMRDMLIDNTDTYNETFTYATGRCKLIDVRRFYKALQKPTVAAVNLLFSKAIRINKEYEEFIYPILSIREDIVYAKPEEFKKGLIDLIQQSFKLTNHGKCMTVLWHNILKQYVNFERYETCIQPNNVLVGMLNNLYSDSVPYTLQDPSAVSIMKTVTDLEHTKPLVNLNSNFDVDTELNKLLYNALRNCYNRR